MRLAPTAFTCTKISRQTIRGPSGKVVSGVGPNEYMKSIGKFRIHSSRGRHIMRENHITHLVEIPIGGHDGFTWNRLHAEREEICETLLTEPTYIERQILQSRLRKVDDALDRLMSGAYGYCSRCGRAIESVKLEIDPAVALCRACRNPKASLDVSEKEQSESAEVLLET